MHIQKPAHPHVCDLYIIQNIYGSFNSQNTKSSSSDCHVSLWRLQERPRLTLSFDLTGKTHPAPVNGSSYGCWVGCTTPRVSGSLCTNILNQLNPWSMFRQMIISTILRNEVSVSGQEAALLYQRWVLSTGEQPFMPCCLNNIKQVFKAADMSSSDI